MKDSLTIPVDIKQDENGYVLVSCPALPVYTEGRGRAHAKEMIVDAVECFFDGCREGGIFAEVMAKIGYEGHDPLPDIKLDFGGEILSVRHLRSFESEPAAVAAYG